MSVFGSQIRPVLACDAYRRVSNALGDRWRADEPEMRATLRARYCSGVIFRLRAKGEGSVAMAFAVVWTVEIWARVRKAQYQNEHHLWVCDLHLGTYLRGLD